MNDLPHPDSGVSVFCTVLKWELKLLVVEKISLGNQLSRWNAILPEATSVNFTCFTWVEGMVAKWLKPKVVTASSNQPIIHVIHQCQVDIAFHLVCWSKRVLKILWPFTSDVYFCFLFTRNSFVKFHAVSRIRRYCGFRSRNNDLILLIGSLLEIVSKEKGCLLSIISPKDM